MKIAQCLTLSHWYGRVARQVMGSVKNARAFPPNQHIHTRHSYECHKHAFCMISKNELLRIFSAGLKNVTGHKCKRRLPNVYTIIQHIYTVCAVAQTMSQRINVRFHGTNESGIMQKKNKAAATATAAVDSTAVATCISVILSRWEMVDSGTCVGCLGGYSHPYIPRQCDTPLCDSATHFLWPKAYRHFCK